MIYLFVFLFLGIFAIVYDFGGVKFGKFFFYGLTLLTLVLLSGLRFEVGGDTYRYIYQYDFMPSLSQLDGYAIERDKLQPLWVLFTAIARTLSEDFVALQLLHATIVNVTIFRFFIKNTKYFHTAALVYSFSLYPFFNFEILRESLAICIFLLSLEYLTKRMSLPKFYGLAVTAFLLHASAIMLFIIPILQRLRLHLLSASVLFVFCFAINPYFGTFLGSLGALPRSFSVIGDYLEYQYTLLGLASLYLLYIAFPYFLMHYSKKILRIEFRYYDLVSAAIILGAITPLLFVFFRFLNFLSPIILLLSVEALHGTFRRLPMRSMRGFATGLLFLFLVVFHTYRYFSDTSELAHNSRWYSRWYPYYSVFDKQIDPIRQELNQAESAR